MGQAPCYSKIPQNPAHALHAKHYLYIIKASARKDVNRLLFICVIPFFCCVYCLTIGLLCRNPSNLETTLDRLSAAKVQNNINVRQGHRHRKVKNYTNYTYEYQVKAKTYRIRGGKICTPGQLSKMPRIVYLRYVPRIAYAEGVTYFPHLILSALFGFSTLLFLIIDVVITLLAA